MISFVSQLEGQQCSISQDFLRSVDYLHHSNAHPILQLADKFYL